MIVQSLCYGHAETPSSNIQRMACCGPSRTSHETRCWQVDSHTESQAIIKVIACAATYSMSDRWIYVCFHWKNESVSVDTVKRVCASVMFPTTSAVPDVISWQSLTHATCDPFAGNATISIFMSTALSIAHRKPCKLHHTSNVAEERSFKKAARRLCATHTCDVI